MQWTSRRLKSDARVWETEDLSGLTKEGMQDIAGEYGNSICACTLYTHSEKIGLLESSSRDRLPTDILDSDTENI